jgi:phosphoenolpyruvate carboxykinase (ATP)
LGIETENGTLIINTGKLTGRSPQDSFIVKYKYREEKIFGREKLATH